MATNGEQNTPGVSKRPLINYTSRDFDTIKTDLVDYAKRYYPDSFKDFNEAGFGSLMLDTVAYVGDILSFYVDYQANESFLQTAVEYGNVRKLAEQNGYKFTGPASSVGICDFYVLVPAAVIAPETGPNRSYVPVLRRNTVVASSEGASFVLMEDVRFDTSTTEVVAARFNNTTGLPTYYALRNSGKVISGRFNTEYVYVGEYEKFRRVKLNTRNISEIISVTDANGHDYYEVDYLTQNVIYRDIINKHSSDGQVDSFLRPYPVPRRFVSSVDNEGNTYLQFGFGSEDELNTPSFVDPKTLLLKQTGKNYETERSFDPSMLLNSDKMGIGPSNTTLTVVYRYNDANSVNVPSNRLNTVSDAILEFESVNNLDIEVVRTVRNSLEVNNQEQVVGQVSIPTTDELRNRAYSVFSSQNRAVTQNDLQSIIYGMPTKYGSIKRAIAYKDTNSFKRNINVYVLSEDLYGKLVRANSILKDNLRIWISKYKMLHDTIDILDGSIVNFGIEFTILVDPNYDKNLVLAEAKQKLAEHFSQPRNFGESLSISEIYSVLNKNVKGAIDAKRVRIVNRVGGVYSTSSFTFDMALSADGTYLVVPKNVCMELKYSDLDIKGVAE
jgi:hypothetical protein